MSRKFATLDDFRKDDKMPPTGSEDDEDAPQRFFTGGERSGQFVEGPDRSRDLLRDLFEKASRNTPVDPNDQERESKKKETAFIGTGYKLGSDEEPSVVIPAPPASSTPRSSTEPAVRHLTFWKDGFSVEDGPLMRYDDPVHRETLAMINRGVAPISILSVEPGQPVECRIAKRMNEDYIPPPKIAKPFEGHGQRLGGGSGQIAVVQAVSPTSITHTASTSSFQVNDSNPVARLQIRLTDGTRLVARFNHHHTVGDLRQFVNAARPSQQAYSLNAGFPLKPLTDDTQTIAEAGLINAVIVQKLV